MLRERYPIDKLFADILQLIPHMDPALAKIDRLLEDEELFRLICKDLSQRRPLTLKTGRPSTPVEVVLRMLVVKRLYNYSYEKTEQQVSDSLVLRQFCRVYLERVPDDTTLLRAAQQIQPETLEQFNQRITHLAQQLQITKGRKLRTDGTVVQTNIHTPSDSRQLADSVRVLARTVARAQEALGEAGGTWQESCEALTKAAKQKAHQIGEALRKRSQQAKAAGQQAYQELVDMTQETVRQAQEALAQLQQQTSTTAQALAQTLESYLPRVAQVIAQTERRVFHGEQVPAAEKVVSIFEPHTDIIKRGKENRPVEYGHKVWLDEVDGGIISHYRILEGNPNDQEQWVPSLEAHQRLFDKPPELASADRGLYSPDNEQAAQDRGVNQVILPQSGHRSQPRVVYERQEWFVAGRHWHAGIEGRISVLKRAHGLECCLDHGLDGFHRWVGWGVIGGNLAVIGRSVTKGMKLSRCRC